MNAPLPPTLLSTIQRYQRQTLPRNVTHSFASSADESYALLQDLSHTAVQLVNSLNIYASTPLSNPKLVSLFRQHSSIVHTSHQADQSTQQIIDALRKRPTSRYGEDIPLDSVSIVDWCISRLETWGTSVGMETFVDNGREGGITVVLGGKVLVVDVDLTVDRTNTLKPNVKVSNVKTSYAISNAMSGSTSNAGNSTSLDGLLYGTIERFYIEVQKAEGVRNSEEVARFGANILEQLRYLVMLDRLAAGKADGGLRWFADVDQFCPTLERFAKSEGEVVASSLLVKHAPLDIFLLRSHALPLPYLTSPSISFLIYMSPLAYLSLLRQSPEPVPSQDNPNLPQLDIPLTALRSWLVLRPKGVTLANLILAPTSGAQLFPASMSMPTFTTRPTFPFVPQGSEIEHVFPQTTDLSSSMSPFDESASQHIWMLDFTDSGRYPGIVMSQSRMRDIELVVNPLGGMVGLNPVGILSFGNRSWVDLLLNQHNPGFPERYTALYTSPTSAHPPLHLRLTAPDEPGFRLEKVPVHSMKEVWGILEVVREQCWLNELLVGCQWTAESLKTVAFHPQETEATEEELQAVLSGKLMPRKIPVNVFLPSHNIVTDSLFETPDLDAIPQMQHRRPKIIMTSPEQPPISGLVEITVTYDEARPRGVVVEVSGAMSSDIKLDVLEEICRRGGTLGLSGRVWSKSHESSCT
ncbi:hypothetical protein L208DRAFT_1283223 [Tricholoma matsutake]|nr:hypothetical protein L208DRAFT_1283223 [Tricholoma matsutake 945]